MACIVFCSGCGRCRGYEKGKRETQCGKSLITERRRKEEAEVTRVYQKYLKNRRVRSVWMRLLQPVSFRNKIVICHLASWCLQQQHRQPGYNRRFANKKLLYDILQKCMVSPALHVQKRGDPESEFRQPAGPRLACSMSGCMTKDEKSAASNHGSSKVDFTGRLTSIYSSQTLSTCAGLLIAYQLT